MHEMKAAVFPGMGKYHLSALDGRTNLLALREQIRKVLFDRGETPANEPESSTAARANATEQQQPGRTATDVVMNPVEQTRQPSPSAATSAPPLVRAASYFRHDAEANEGKKS